MKTNTTRFSNRVDDYIKFRPHYPKEIIEVLKNKIGLNKDFTIADIGAGTGISSELFINNRNKVYAVEPNTEMREAGQLIFGENSNFISVNGKAENTSLPDNSIDLIFCGQAFHWFDKPKTKIEFNRILKPHGHIALAWNLRSETSDFQKEYEYILSSNISEYKDVTHKNISEEMIKEFFKPKEMFLYSLGNDQQLNLEGLKGRLQSSSYCPKEGPEHNQLFKDIESLFVKFERNGLVKFEYETKIFYC